MKPELTSSGETVLSSARVQHEQAGWRADRAFCALAGNLNRRAAKKLFHSRLVRLNGRIAAGSERVAEGDCFECPPTPASGFGPWPLVVQGEEAKPQATCLMPKAQGLKPKPRLTTPHGRHLRRLYEDEAILVISKPAEVLVHRGQGGFTRRDTLEDVLKRAYPEPGSGSGLLGVAPSGAPYGATASASRDPLPAPGFYFVHRLDMETSGCLVIAKTEAARDALIRAFASRAVHKEYLALVAGTVNWDALSVRKPIKYLRAGDAVGRGPRAGSPCRKAVPVLPGQKKGIALEEGSAEGKPCETHFQVVARYRGYTLLRAAPKTGRTHQIRVHLQSIGHPLAYDPLYGRATAMRARELFAGAQAGPDDGDRVILSRLPLHAWKLRFDHPETGKTIGVTAPLPRDLKEFLRLLRKAAGA